MATHAVDGLEKLIVRLSVKTASNVTTVLPPRAPHLAAMHWQCEHDKPILGRLHLVDDPSRAREIRWADRGTDLLRPVARITPLTCQGRYERSAGQRDRAQLSRPHLYEANALWDVRRCGYNMCKTAAMSPLRTTRVEVDVWYAVACDLPVHLGHFIS